MLMCLLPSDVLFITIIIVEALIIDRFSGLECTQQSLLLKAILKSVFKRCCCLVFLIPRCDDAWDLICCRKN